MCIGLAEQELTSEQLKEHWEDWKRDVGSVATIEEAVASQVKSKDTNMDSLWKATGLPDDFQPQPNDSESLKRAKLLSLQKMWATVKSIHLDEQAYGRNQRLQEAMLALSRDIKAAQDLDKRYARLAKASTKT